MVSIDQIMRHHPAATGFRRAPHERHVEERRCSLWVADYCYFASRRPRLIATTSAVIGRTRFPRAAGNTGATHRELAPVTRQLFSAPGRGDELRLVIAGVADDRTGLVIVEARRPCLAAISTEPARRHVRAIRPRRGWQQAGGGVMTTSQGGTRPPRLRQPPSGSSASAHRTARTPRRPRQPAPTKRKESDETYVPPAVSRAVPRRARAAPGPGGPATNLAVVCLSWGGLSSSPARKT